MNFIFSPKAKFISSFSCYTTTSTESSVYFFGGYPSQNNNRVAKFFNHNWTEVGSLNYGRYGHGSLTIGSETIQIGGLTSGKAFTEIWEIPSCENRIINPELDSAFSGYQVGLFAVDKHFCNLE